MISGDVLFLAAVWFVVVVTDSVEAGVVASPHDVDVVMVIVGPILSWIGVDVLL
jgi:hypothetical protein